MDRFQPALGFGLLTGSHRVLDGASYLHFLLPIFARGIQLSLAGSFFPFFQGCEINSQSAPDSIDRQSEFQSESIPTNWGMVVTLPQAEEVEGRLRHGLYDDPQCAERIAGWLNPSLPGEGDERSQQTSRKPRPGRGVVEIEHPIPDLDVVAGCGRCHQHAGQAVSSARRRSAASIGMGSAFNGKAHPRHADRPGRSHSPGFDHRLRPETLRTAMATGGGLLPQRPQTIEGSSVQAGSTPSSHFRTCGSCRKSVVTMVQLATPTCREMDGRGRSHSPSFDQRRRPETLRTAMATAFFCPTNTTSRLPRVTPV